MDNVLCTVPAVHNHQPRTSGEREGGREGERDRGREGGREGEGEVYSNNSDIIIHLIISTNERVILILLVL